MNISHTLLMDSCHSSIAYFWNLHCQSFQCFNNTVYMCSEQCRKQEQIYYKQLVCKPEAESDKGISTDVFLKLRVGEAKKSNRYMLFHENIWSSYFFEIPKQYKQAFNYHWQWSSLHSIESSCTMWIINMVQKKMPRSKVPIVCTDECYHHIAR